jgi:hypothetical protein
VNFVRDVGSEGGRLALQPLISRPIRLADVVTFTPFAGAIIAAYTKTVTGTQVVSGGIVVEDTVNDPLVRPLAVVGAELTARGSRVYSAGFWGIDALMHVIEPRVSYTFIDGRGTEGVPQWTALDRIGNTSLATYSLINRLFARSIAPPGTEPAKLEVGRFTISQGYDALNQTTPFTPLFAELILNPSPVLYFRGDVAYDVYGTGLQSATTTLGVVQPHFGAAVGTTYNQPANVNFLQGTAFADITRYVTARFQTNWDMQSGKFVENRYGLEVKFQCWALVAEYVTRFRSEDEFRVTLNLLGVGGIGSGIGPGSF